MFQIAAPVNEAERARSALAAGAASPGVSSEAVFVETEVVVLQHAPARAFEIGVLAVAHAPEEGPRPANPSPSASGNRMTRMFMMRPSREVRASLRAARRALSVTTSEEPDMAAAATSGVASPRSRSGPQPRCRALRTRGSPSSVCAPCGRCRSGGDGHQAVAEEDEVGRGLGEIVGAHRRDRDMRPWRAPARRSAHRRPSAPCGPRRRALSSQAILSEGSARLARCRYRDRGRR